MKFFFVFGCVLVLLPLLCFGTSIYVVSGSEGGDGSKDKPFGSLQDAWNIAQNGDTIYLAPGNYPAQKGNSGFVMDTRLHDITIQNTDKTTHYEEVIIDYHESDSEAPFISLSPDARYVTPSVSLFYLTFSDKKQGSMIDINVDDSSEISMQYCTFQSNFYGNSNLISANNSTFTLIRSLFEYNTGNSSVIFLNQCSADIEHTNFNNNTANATKDSFTRGGVLHISGQYYPQRNAYITQSNFFNNTADEGGGLYVGPNAHVSTKSCVFKNNWAKRGGGIFSEGFFEARGTKSIFNCAEEGGGMMISSGEVLLNGGDMGHNLVTNDGGGIYMSGEILVMKGSPSASSNTCGGKGGGMYVSEGQLRITRATISYNHALYGGAVYLEEDAEVLSIASFSASYNSAQDGGALVFHRPPCDPDVQMSLKFNSATNRGGALFVNSSSGKEKYDFNFTDLDMRHNQASSGGAIYAENVKSLSVYNAYMWFGTGDTGAGIAVENIPKVYLDSHIIKSNEANVIGGAVWANNVQNFTIVEANITKNEGGGPVIYLKNSSGMIFNSSIDRNSPGGIFLDNCGSFILNNSLIVVGDEIIPPNNILEAQGIANEDDFITLYENLYSDEEYDALALATLIQGSNTNFVTYGRTHGINITDSTYTNCKDTSSGILLVSNNSQLAYSTKFNFDINYLLLTNSTVTDAPSNEEKCLSGLKDATDHDFSMNTVQTNDSDSVLSVNNTQLVGENSLKTSLQWNVTYLLLNASSTVTVESDFLAKNANFSESSSLVMDGSVLSATNIELFPGVTIGDHKKQKFTLKPELLKIHKNVTIFGNVTFSEKDGTLMFDFDNADDHAELFGHMELNSVNLYSIWSNATFDVDEEALLMHWEGYQGIFNKKQDHSYGQYYYFSPVLYPDNLSMTFSFTDLSKPWIRGGEHLAMLVMVGLMVFLFSVCLAQTLTR